MIQPKSYYFRQQADDEEVPVPVHVMRKWQGLIENGEVAWAAELAGVRARLADAEAELLIRQGAIQLRETRIRQLEARIAAGARVFATIGSHAQTGAEVLT